MESIKLAGVSFTPDEVYELWHTVQFDFSRSPRSGSLFDCYADYPEFAQNAVSVLQRSVSIAADAGKVFLKDCISKKSEFPCYHGDYLSCPISFFSFEVWALIQAVQDAELAFLEVCSTENIEVQLTGHLIQLLTSKSERVQSKYERYLSQSGARLSVQKLELQVKKREKDTGGDFALLFEWTDVHGDLKICPVVFQAKRSVPVEVDISQSNPESGLQLAVLAKSTCNPSYIFYNCDSQGELQAPRLATVKSVKSVLLDGLPSKTHSMQGSLSLSVFIIDVLSGGDYGVVDSRTAAIKAILPSAEKAGLAEIITLGTDPAALLEYETAYETYLRANRKLIPGQGR